jgi:polysaccharide deacetylase
MSKLLVHNRFGDCESPEPPWGSAHHESQSTLAPMVLTYHETCESEPTYEYALSCPKLEEHLQLVADLRQNPRGRKFILTFDDGHISNYHSALPLLEKYSCQAIFFVIVGRIGTDERFMDWRQLRELVSLGHQIEAHSWSHIFLTRCSDPQLQCELRQSKQTLEDQLGVPVDSLSAPHGRWNDRLVGACVECGYRKLYVSDPWMESKRLRGLEIIGRLMVRRSMDGAGLKNWFNMGPMEAICRRAQYSLRQSARSTLGDSLYHRLWCWCSGWEGPDDLG